MARPAAKMDGTIAGGVVKLGGIKDPDHIKETVRVLAASPKNMENIQALFGIELLNEPSHQIPVEILKNFYLAAYSEIRKYAGPEVAVVFHDSFPRHGVAEFYESVGLLERNHRHALIPIIQ